MSQVALKFQTGGWITLLITGRLVAAAVAIKRFYHQAGRSLARLDHLMATAAEIDVQALDGRHRGDETKATQVRPQGKTAVLLVSGFNGTGLHTLFSIRRVFGDTFRTWLFIQAGIIDADRFKGAEGMDRLRKHVETGLSKYVRFMRAKGYNAEGIAAIGTDVSEEICSLAQGIFRDRPTAVFFGGQIVFPRKAFSPASSSTTLPSPSSGACTGWGFPSSSCRCPSGPVALVPRLPPSVHSISESPGTGLSPGITQRAGDRKA